MVGEITERMLHYRPLIRWVQMDDDFLGHF